MDTALDYMDYMHPQDLIDPNSESSAWKQKLLKIRASLPLTSVSPKIEPTERERPHSGHGSARVGAAAAYEKGPGLNSELSYRFALHDMLDPTAGYPDYSQIEFMNVRARYYFQPQRIELEDIALIRIMSLNPISTFNSGMSWRVELGAKRFRDNTCDRCFGSFFELGGGYAVNPISKLPFTLFGLGEIETSYSPSFYTGKLRMGAGPSAGFVLGQSSLKAFLKAGYRYQPLASEHSTYQISSDIRWSINTSLALSLRGSAYNNDTVETGVAAYFYY
jgi:hypothetical protein